MSDQYFGTVKKTESKAGNEYFKGNLGKVPVVGFWGKDGNINFKLDVGLIKWIDDKEDDEKPEVNANVAEQEPVVNGNVDDEHLPF
jgi:hypothetical protein